MELLIPSIAYLVVLTYINVRLLRKTVKSRNQLVRSITYVIVAIFSIYQVSGLAPFIMNENGKSYTTGWFGLIYFLVVSFTILFVVSILLRLVDKRLTAS